MAEQQCGGIRIFGSWEKKYEKGHSIVCDLLTVYKLDNTIKIIYSTYSNKGGKKGRTNNANTSE